MRNLLLFISLLSVPLYGQVAVDVPIDFIGDVEQRGIDGLALPIAADAAITVEASLLGVANWAEATVVTNVITLQPTVPISAYRDGQLLRFIAPMNVFGVVTLACDGLVPAPLVRPDGVWPARGQIRSGVICEVLFADGRWILMNAPELGCPHGTIAANAHLCIEVYGQQNLLFYPASDRCLQMGGRLCKWWEYHAACTLLNADLNGMGASWEWIDDTQNHAHTAVIVGLDSCTAQQCATICASAAAP